MGYGDGGDCASLEALWQRYQKNRGKGLESELALRSELVEYYLPLVRIEAVKMFTSLKGKVEFDELVSEGAFGLIEAVESFDCSRGIKFQTFASYRISGSMVDFCRREDLLSRGVRQQIKSVEKATECFMQMFGVLPDNQSVAEASGVPVDKLNQLKRFAQPWISISDERDHENGGSLRGVSSLVADKSVANPEEEVARIDLCEFLLRGLSRQQRIILRLHYYEGLTFEEIGAWVGKSESRISQTMSEIFHLIRSRFSEREDAFLEEVMS